MQNFFHTRLPEQQLLWKLKGFKINIQLFLLLGDKSHLLNWNVAWETLEFKSFHDNLSLSVGPDTFLLKKTEKPFVEPLITAAAVLVIFSY